MSTVQEDCFKVQFGDNQSAQKTYYCLKKQVFVLNIPYDISKKSFSSWRLYSKTQEYTGNTVEELRFLIVDLIQKMKLKKVTPPGRKCPTIDGLVIFVDNLLKIKDIFSGILTEEKWSGDLITRVIVYDHFIFQSTKQWHLDRIEKKYDVLDIVQEIMNIYCIPDNHLYISPQKIDRVRLERASKGGKLNNIREYYPKGYMEWKCIRDSMQPPIRYYNEDPSPQEKILAVDLKSAYPYALLAFRHCASYTEKVNPKSWRNYLNRSDKGSFGVYDITYSTYMDYIKHFQTYDGSDFSGDGGIQTVRAILTNVDLDTLTNLRGVTIHGIDCLDLHEFEMDYTPEYYRECIKAGYLDKKKYPKDTIPYDLAKLKLNSGVYGNTIIKTPEYVVQEAVREGKSSREVCKAADKAVRYLSRSGTLPHWGIWAISYIRQIMLKLGQQLTGWLYSNTDSIYCLDTPENREFIKSYNEQVEKEVKKLCEEFNYNFEDFQDLGQFEIGSLKHFRAWDKSSYAYEDMNGNVTVKASGCKLTKNYTSREVFGDIMFRPEWTPYYVGSLDKNGHYYEREIGKDEWYMLNLCKDF